MKSNLSLGLAVVAVLMAFGLMALNAIDTARINDLSRRVLCLEDWTQNYKSPVALGCNSPKALNHDPR